MLIFQIRIRFSIIVCILGIGYAGIKVHRQTKAFTNRQLRPVVGQGPTMAWHVFQYLAIMTFRRGFRAKSPRRIGNQIIQLDDSCRYGSAGRGRLWRLQREGEMSKVKGDKRGQAALVMDHTTDVFISTFGGFLAAFLGGLLIINASSRRSWPT